MGFKREKDEEEEGTSVESQATEICFLGLVSPCGLSIYVSCQNLISHMTELKQIQVALLLIHLLANGPGKETEDCSNLGPLSSM